MWYPARGHAFHLCLSAIIVPLLSNCTGVPAAIVGGAMLVGGAGATAVVDSASRVPESSPSIEIERPQQLDHD